MNFMTTNLAFSIIILTGLTDRNELVPTAHCICPEQKFTYNCTVVGRNLTIWSGTVFMPGCEEIILHHNQYEDHPEYRSCNDGAIVGQSIEVLNNSYRSNLTISVTSRLEGRTVICSAADKSNITIIGSTTLLITRGKPRQNNGRINFDQWFVLFIY